MTQELLTGCVIQSTVFCRESSNGKKYLYSKASKTTQKLINEFSETFEVISQAYDNDKKIDTQGSE